MSAYTLTGLKKEEHVKNVAFLKGSRCKKALNKDKVKVTFKKKCIIIINKTSTPYILI